MTSPPPPPPGLFIVWCFFSPPSLALLAGADAGNGKRTYADIIKQQREEAAAKEKADAATLAAEK